MAKLQSISVCRATCGQRNESYIAQSATDNQADKANSDNDNVSDIDGTDMTKEATTRFEVIDKNIFVRVTNDASKHEESIPCHCRYNPDTDDRWQACGENSDCINRLVQMECNPLTCPCGSHCLNRRFQKHQYAKVRIVDAGRKGFGMQALEDLETGSFVMEYMGEVVTATEFRKRARVYQSEGISHHYFMSIGNGKVIDATRKGCIARFINHSCGPNCVLQKWMVGGAIRMGIFTERPIKRGEEITFDYKFERMADSEPQPCYCGSPECKGIIGVVKERGTRLAASDEDIDADAADIDEEITDGAVTRHQRDDIRRRHAAVDDEEYGDAGYSDSDNSDSERGIAHNRRRKNGLTSPEQVLKFVQIMHRSSRQTRIIGILIGKLTETSDKRLLKSLISLQGLGILRAWLQDYAEDDVMMIKILQCIAHMPISTRNTIDESRLEEAVKPLCSDSDENVSSLANTLVERWSSLRRVFKIPKKSKKESTPAAATPVAATPAASRRQSPSRTNAPTPQPSGVDGRDLGSGGSPGQTRWRDSPAPPSRMRSASPMVDTDGSYNQSQRPSNMGWGRRGGFRGQSPGGSMRINRSPSRPNTGYQRYPPHASRSRSPQNYRRPVPSRFARPTTDEYQPSRQAVQPAFGHSEPMRDSSHAQFPAQRGRYGRWNDQQRGFRSERPHEMDANGDKRGYPYRRPDPARYESSASADETPRLAPGWHTAYTNDGIPYYYHGATKETRWEPPVAEQVPKDTRYARLGVDSPGTTSGHFSRRRLDVRVYSAAPSASLAGTGGWNSSSGSRMDRSYTAPADNPNTHGPKVDDIVDRAMRLGVHTPAQKANGKPGSTQLVTPETDGEPPTGSAIPHTSMPAQPALAKPPSTSGTRRSSPDSGPHAQPPSKREKLEKKASTELANFVVRAMNKHKAQMSHDDFKHEARKVTKILMEKERKGGAFDPLKLIELSQHKKAKIAQFIDDYMTRLLARQSAINS
ncbi:hypothetical protein IWW56_002863 [Coemansia sp. RSA 2131]|nr:hypothetical protein IWW56_002863 [Coemansia sp. RSA 2131]